MNGVRLRHAADFSQGPLFRVGTPPMLVLPLECRPGHCSVPVVSKGERVRRHQRLAKADGLAADVYGPADATVAGIARRKFSDGVSRRSLVLKTARSARSGTRGQGMGKLPVLLKEAHKLVGLVEACGIVGLGGAMFPAHIKLRTAHEVDTVLVNGAECEPVNSSDKWLMANRPEEVAIGTRLLMAAARAARACICAKETKYFRGLARNIMQGITARKIAGPYPLGAEQVLIRRALGKTVPPGKNPAESGVLVFNVSTAYAVYEGLIHNKPLVERIVTVSGRVARPGNYVVKIGTPVRNIVASAGGPGSSIVVAGGLMMGTWLESAEAALLPGTGSLHLCLPADRSEAACIRCGRCIDACPMGLSPKTIAALVRNSRAKSAAEHHANECIECGACSFICPSGINLVGLVKKAKGETCG